MSNYEYELLGDGTYLDLWIWKDQELILEVPISYDQVQEIYERMLKCRES